MDPRLRSPTEHERPANSVAGRWERRSYGVTGRDVEVMPPHTNTALVVVGPALLVQDRHHSTPTCADAVLDVSAALAANTDDRIVSIGDVIRAVCTDNGVYPINTVYRTIQRLTANIDDNRCPTVLQRVDRHRLRVP